MPHVHLINFYSWREKSIVSLLVSLCKEDDLSAFLNGPTGAHPSIRESNAVNSEIGKYERVPVPPSGSAPIVISPKYSDVTALRQFSTSSGEKSQQKTASSGIRN